ncbi:MAG: DUF3806 domain-containing protein [Halieaceae bacterium]|jgi:hypothetical protein|nr:DUF3806 domain-containing protein [Halieaceae bacterium]
MFSSKNLQNVLLAITVGLFTPSTLAQGTVRISELSPIDHHYMNQQKTVLDDLARRHLGARFTGNKGRDLGVLQRLLDQKHVGPSQAEELQAMGIILGELLARDLDMHWVIYQDNLGRSRALRYRETDNYLFPITMISRLRAAGNNKPVIDIYERAYNTIEPLTERLPFQ